MNSSNQETNEKHRKIEMKTATLTKHIRHMKRFGDNKNIIWHFNVNGSKYHYGLQQVDYIEPTGGGSIAAEQDLFNDPMLIFKWEKNRSEIFNDNLLASKSNWMKRYNHAQRCWLNRVFPK